MIKSILTGLAVTLSAGVMLGVRTKRGGSGNVWSNDTAGGRLEAIELRMSGLENAIPAHSDSGETAALRGAIAALESNHAGQITGMGQRLDDLQSHLPRFIDVKVGARVREMEDRLKAEMAETRGKTLEAFMSLVEKKMLACISGIEDSLRLQSREIGDLREQSGQTDGNLSRIILTIERLAPPAELAFTRFAAVANGTNA